MPRETIEVNSDTNHEPYKGFWSFLKRKPKQSSSKGFEHKHFLFIPPPPPYSHEYKLMKTLLEDAERWKNVGDKELQSKTWQIIADRATQYAKEAIENNTPL